MELRPYQQRAASQLVKMLDEKGLAYLCGECRTGKTITALTAAVDYVTEPLIRDAALRARGVLPSLSAQDRREYLYSGRAAARPEEPQILIVSKKSALSSIRRDVDALASGVPCVVINYESIHKIDANENWQVIIVDEAHCVGAYPKPTKRWKDLTAFTRGHNAPRMILMSGTPSPESFSQLFHQYTLSPRHPWAIHYKNFYRWADDYVNITSKRVGTGIEVKDYSQAKEDRVLTSIAPWSIEMTQEEAGFEVTIEEKMHKIKMKKPTYVYMKNIIKDGITTVREDFGCSERNAKPGRGIVLADTGAKVKSKLKQISNGHVITEEHGAIIFDNSKMEYIKETFAGMKVAIMYCYKAERLMLIKTLGKENITEKAETFNATDHNIRFIGQIQSSREGVNLSAATDLVFVGIDYSALSYLQSRERLSHLGRKIPPRTHYLLAKSSLEPKVLETVQRKEDFTVAHYKNERTGLSEQIDQNLLRGRVFRDQINTLQHERLAGSAAAQASIWG